METESEGVDVVLCHLVAWRAGQLPLEVMV